MVTKKKVTKKKSPEKKIEEGFKELCKEETGKKKDSASHHASCGGLYFMGFIGAAIYYIQTSTGFWMGVLGILKAMVWPAFLVYAALKQLGL